MPRTFELRGENGARIACSLRSTDVPEWLSGSAELSVPGFTGSIEIEGGVDVLRDFEQQLAALDADLNGRAELAFDVGLRLAVTGDRGSVLVSGSASHWAGDLGNLLEFSFRSDQTLIREAARGMATSSHGGTR